MPEKEIAVKVRLPDAQRSDPEIFRDLLVANKFNNLIPLMSVVKLEESQGLRAVNHLDGKRTVSVSAEVDNRNITSSGANRLLKREMNRIMRDFPGYTVKYGGEHQEQEESMKSLLSAFLFPFFRLLPALFEEHLLG